MEKSMKRENILVEYSLQGVSSSSGKTQHRSSETDDMDFNDVFGGPPKRFSMQDVRVRYSFGETTESEEEKSPWDVLKEKPVFGDEIVARRRRKGEDFFDDIFGGEESRKNSPSSSRIMSPVRSFTPKAEPYGTSLPSQFSLTPKLVKAVDHTVFGSRNSNQYKTYNSSSGLNSPHSSSNSLSRFSNRVTQSQDETRNELYHQSTLSREGSLSSDKDLESDEKGNTEKLKRETNTTDQFHFSIYKWAGSGVPMLVMPLIGRNNLKSKGVRGNYDEMEIDHVKSEPINVTNQGFSVEFEKKELKIKEVVNKVQISAEGAVREIPESKSQSKAKSTIGFGKATKILKSIKLKSVDAVDVKEKVDGETPKTIKDFIKSADVKRTDTKENTVKTAKGAYSSDHSITNEDKNNGPGNDPKRQNIGKANLQDGSINSGTTTSKSGVKGKVKGFVQIFSQEDTKTKADSDVRTQSFRSKAAGLVQKESEESSTAANVKGNVNLHNVKKKPDIFPKVDENMKDKAQTPNNLTSNRYNDSPTKQNNVTSAESLNRKAEIPVDYPDDTSEDNFVVEEIFDDQEKRTQSGAEGSDDMKALDAKIQQWSVGKKGNIRSLLSTLQYVLWPESGWIAVPLVDLIEGNSVKRAYQKALLRLHPDKLQQKGAADSHKYIAQKVFDILQEAWDHFNTIAPL